MKVGDEWQWITSQYASILWDPQRPSSAQSVVAQQERRLCERETLREEGLSSTTDTSARNHIRWFTTETATHNYHSVLPEKRGADPCGITDTY